MRIAYAGAEGAFAHEACLEFAPELRPLAVESFGAVVAAVEGGEAEAGMLPLRNSRAGEVDEVRVLLENSALRISRECPLPVRMHLLGIEGATISELRAVTSHPVALRQCAASLDRLGLDTRAAANTAVAARELRDGDVAVLASEAAARAYGLTIIKHDMQDDPNNVTVFGIVERTN